MATKNRYTYKYPTTTWDEIRADLRTHKRSYWYSIKKAADCIVNMMRPGYTSEPYMQLIEVSHNGSMRVVAERTQGEWLVPSVASGFTSRRVA